MNLHSKLNESFRFLGITRQSLLGKKILWLQISIILSSIFWVLAGCVQPIPTEPVAAPRETATAPVKETQTSAQEPTAQLLRKPDIEVHLEPGAFSQGGWDFKIEVVFSNPNPGSIDLGSLIYTAKDGKGHIYAQDTVPGGSLAPKSKSSFVHNMMLPLDVFLGTGMLVTVETIAEANGITIPINRVTNAPNMRQLYATPKMDLSFDWGKLYPNGFNSKLSININNYYPLRLNVGLLQMKMKGQTGNTVKIFYMEPGYVEPKSTGTFTSDVTILASALNEKQITLTAEGMAGVENTTMSLKGASTISVPSLASFVSDLKSVTSIPECSWRATYPAPDIFLHIESVVSNNNTFDLALSKLKYLVYNDKGDQIAEQQYESSGDFIISAKETKTITNDMALASEIKKLINTDITIKVQMEFVVDSVTEKVILSDRIAFLLKPL